jgi:hypothetical protein
MSINDVTAETVGGSVETSEAWAKALAANIKRQCQRRIPCDYHTQEDNAQSVFERILSDAKELLVDLDRLRSCPEYQRQVVRKKVEAVRSQLRRDRGKAMATLYQHDVGGLCRERGRFEAREELTTLVARAALSNQEQRSVAVYFTESDPEKQAAALGVTKQRLANLKNKTLDRLKLLLGDLTTNYIE